jgi:hypothetical protein
VELSLITNDVVTAQSAEQAGVDRIMIDLERLGKSERQIGKGLFLSSHQTTDIPRVRAVLQNSKLMVRVDPIHAASARQIGLVIDAGADFVMLPYFQTRAEAQLFVSLVGGKARAVLLVETREAAARLAELCQLKGVAEIHIGLNDLSLSMGKPFLFDLVADDTIDRLCAVLRSYGVPFGYGGLGRLSRRDLPVSPELVLAHQVTQGATRGWLGRTFRDLDPADMVSEIGRLRQAISRWKQATPFEIELLHSDLRRQIAAVSQRRAA